MIINYLNPFTYRTFPNIGSDSSLNVRDLASQKPNTKCSVGRTKNVRFESSYLTDNQGIKKTNVRFCSVPKHPKKADSSEWSGILEGFQRPNTEHVKNTGIITAKAMIALIKNRPACHPERSRRATDRKIKTKNSNLNQYNHDQSQNLRAELRASTI